MDFQRFSSKGSFRSNPYRLAPTDDSLKPKPERTCLINTLPYYFRSLY